VNIFGADKYDRILQRHLQPPGKDPRARRGKLSEYGAQLLEKQKVRDMFLLSERQFSRYFREALRSRTATGARLLTLLETRLDNVLYRAGFALTRLQSRQLASHGLFLVNGQIVNRPSCPVRPGDIIEVRPRSLHSPLFTTVLAATEKLVPPSWLKVDPRIVRIEVLAYPSAEHCEQSIDIQRVVELYSR
jgi:small subunit ribosomal protein S4